MGSALCGQARVPQLSRSWAGQRLITTALDRAALPRGLGPRPSVSAQAWSCVTPRTTWHSPWGRPLLCGGHAAAAWPGPAPGGLAPSAGAERPGHGTPAAVLGVSERVSHPLWRPRALLPSDLHAAAGRWARARDPGTQSHALCFATGSFSTRRSPGILTPNPQVSSPVPRVSLLAAGHRADGPSQEDLVALCGSQRCGTQRQLGGGELPGYG